MRLPNRAVAGNVWSGRCVDASSSSSRVCLDRNIYRLHERLLCFVFSVYVKDSTLQCNDGPLFKLSLFQDIVVNSGPQSNAGKDQRKIVSHKGFRTFLS